MNITRIDEIDYTFDARLNNRSNIIDAIIKAFDNGS